MRCAQIFAESNPYKLKVVDSAMNKLGWNSLDVGHIMQCSMQGC